MPASTSRPFLAGLALVLIVPAGCGHSPARPSWSAWAQRDVREAPVLDDRQTVDVQLALGRSLESQQQWSAAAELYRKVLEAHPRQVQAMHRMAICYEQQGDHQTARDWFRQALRLEPANPDLLCDVGYSLYLRRHYDEAEKSYRQAIAARPDHRRAHNHLGLLLAQAGRRDEALASFRKAGCTTAQAHLNMALVLALDDRPTEAEQEIRWAMSAGPPTPELRQRLEQIELLIAGHDAAPADSRVRLVHHDGAEDRPAGGTIRVSDRVPTRGVTAPP